MRSGRSGRSRPITAVLLRSIARVVGLFGWVTCSRNRMGGVIGPISSRPGCRSLAGSPEKGRGLLAGPVPRLAVPLTQTELKCSQRWREVGVSLAVGGDQSPQKRYASARPRDFRALAYGVRVTARLCSHLASSGSCTSGSRARRRGSARPRPRQCAGRCRPARGCASGNAQYMVARVPGAEPAPARRSAAIKGRGSSRRGATAIAARRQPCRRATRDPSRCWRCGGAEVARVRAGSGRARAARTSSGGGLGHQRGQARIGAGQVLGARIGLQSDQ